MACGNCDYRKCCCRQCMQLPAGKKCADCVHVVRCTTMFGVKQTNTTCDFYPVRFREVQNG